MQTKSWGFSLRIHSYTTLGIKSRASHSLLEEKGEGNKLRIGYLLAFPLYSGEHTSLFLAVGRLS